MNTQRFWSIDQEKPQLLGNTLEREIIIKGETQKNSMTQKKLFFEPLQEKFTQTEINNKIPQNMCQQSIVWSLYDLTHVAYRTVLSITHVV